MRVVLGFFVIALKSILYPFDIALIRRARLFSVPFAKYQHGQQGYSRQCCRNGEECDQKRVHLFAPQYCPDLT